MCDLLGVGDMFMTCLYFDREEKLELGVSSIMFLYSFQLYQLPTDFF